MGFTNSTRRRKSLACLEGVGARPARSSASLAVLAVKSSREMTGIVQPERSTLHVRHMVSLRTKHVDPQPVFRVDELQHRLIRWIGCLIGRQAGKPRLIALTTRLLAV